jgi:hypothetical protein
VTERTIAKLVLAMAGIAVFFTGVRLDLGVVRWTGIGLVVAAFLLRFVGRKEPRADQ